MKKNYSESFFKNFIFLVFFLIVNQLFSQQDITLTTTSNSINWSVNFTNSGGLALNWVAQGDGLPTDIVATGNNPNFDFSPNDGRPITVTITSNDNFNFVTNCLAPSRDISSVNISNLHNLQTLELGGNNIATIDISSNIELEHLELNNNDLTLIDLSSNKDLEELDVSFNSLSNVNINGLTNLDFIDLSDNQLTNINLSQNSNLNQLNFRHNLLSTQWITRILADVDAFGTGGFGSVLSLIGNPGEISIEAMESVENLIARNWVIQPPRYYDYGDAPNSYGTDLAMDGPRHIFSDEKLILGETVDAEINGLKSDNAYGDNVDNIDDEDGIGLNQFPELSTLINSYSIEVSYINNLSTDATVYAWIDFNRNGVFDSTEFASTPAPKLSIGKVTLEWADFSNANITVKEGKTFARIRITTEGLSSTDTGGKAIDGEVEDYDLEIIGLTYVPDNNFEYALIDLGYDDVLDDYVVTSNISGVTSLDLYLRGVSDLTGIEGFTDLKFLNCHDNSLTNVDLSQNIYLEELWIARNFLTQLNLSKNSELLRLICPQNRLTRLDVSQNLKLTYLNCIVNQFTSLDVTQNLKLTYLNCHSNNLTSLDVTQNKELVQLNCVNNQLTDLDLSGNPDLIALNCRMNQIKRLDASKNPNLTEFLCDGNKLISLNMKNGNNDILIQYPTSPHTFNEGFDARFNPLLTCIQVDDPTKSSPYNGWKKDDIAVFSENCQYVLGIDDEILSGGLSIYPNPVSELLTLESKTPIKKIEIYTILGQKVIQSSSELGTVSTESLSKGIYILKVFSENGWTTRRLIKQ